MQTQLEVSPRTNKLVPKFDFNLEALRGFAALLVIWHHIILHKYWLDPSYTPTGIFSFVAPGHLSVLVFFVLSGYVIGLAHSKPLEKTGVLIYLKKRFVRIYPIYFISIIFAVLFAKQQYPVTTVLANLTFMQNLVAPVIFENNPAWSLNYEVLFYLLFIPISVFRWNVIVATIIMSLAAVAAYFLGYGLTASYALGFAFWLCGLVLAKHFQRPVVPSFGLMVSMLFLLLSLEQLNVITTVLSKLTIKLLRGDQAFIEEPLRYLDLSYLPYCVVLVLVFASRDFAYRRYIIPVLLLLPIATFYHIFKTPALHESWLLLPSLFYSLSILFYLFRRHLEKWCATFIERLSKTGAISYGLYIIHFPIITIFSRVTAFSGTPSTFFLRLLLYVAFCVAAAYLLEKKFQPWVKKQLM